jgi:ribonucleoside-diphosphate reductase alpha chain
MGPLTEFSEQLHAEKYRAKGESFREAMNRVASALQDNEEHYHAFREILREMRFMPGGRIQAAMGSTRRVTPYNCYVSATIKDTFTDGDRSIMACATRAATTMRMGGGIGYDFSTLRPRGTTIKKLQSQASGPVSFMHIFDAVCKATSSAGHRRGAQMGVLRVDHPDIEEFIFAKRKEGALEGFNVSVGVTDEFMRAVESGSTFDLRFEGEVYETIDARALWENIMRSAWDWAEPGVLFLDTINRMNNLWYCETIAATNPCGEQPLPPDGACLLASFNLVKYLVKGSQGYDFDYAQFEADVEPAVRALDNVIDRATYPLFEQEEEAKQKRRMGIGVTGVANAIEAMGCPYGTNDYIFVQDRILKTLVVAAYKASIQLAKEKGSFPLFDPEKYTDSPFLNSIPELQELLPEIRKYGIRNSHLISIAPTGTISMAADNVSSGIEPVFSYEAERMYIGPDGPEKVMVKDYGVEFLGVRGRRAHEVPLSQHVDVLVNAQRWCDSAVSKTCNLDGSVPWEEFKDTYMRAWRGGAKGCTVFNKDGKRAAMMVPSDNDDASCKLDPVTGRSDCE